VPDGFRFALKMPKEITHVRRFADTIEPLERFLAETAALGEKRAVLLVQLPPSFGFDSMLASAFFASVRERYAGALAFEPRHPTWFSADAEALLRSFQTARVAADPAVVPAAAVPGGWGGFAYYTARLASHLLFRVRRGGAARGREPPSRRDAAGVVHLRQHGARCSSWKRAGCEPAPLGTNVDVYEAIRARCSVAQVSPEPPDRAVVERLLDAATWAPYHHVREPWRFVVIGGAARTRLGEIAAATLRVDDVAPETEAKVREKERTKFERAPLVIAMVALPADDEIDREENYAATVAATQNLLLAATAEGMSGFWRTGRLAREPAILDALGVKEGERVAAYVYLGYPQRPAPPRTREPAASKTEWMQ
jgi:nitroreductase